MPDSGYLVLPTELQRGQLARAEQVNDRMTLVGQAFNKLPTERELKQGKANIGQDSGTANTYVVAQPYPITAYQDGDLFLFRALAANTGASTLNVDTVGTINFLRDNGDALQAGDIAANGALTAARYHAGSNSARIQGSSAADLAAATVQASASAGSAADSLASALASASSAAAAAASALAAANAAAALNGTSASSVAIGTGSKSFTTQTGKQFTVGGFVTVASAANVANYMFGQITTYSGSSLTVDVSTVGGSGTKADWLISVAGSKGNDGPPGATGAGAGDVTGPGSSGDNNLVLFNGATGKVIKDSGVAIGTMASQNAASVTISGGAISGITDLAVADGGTGSSSASGARTNLGLVIGTDVQAYSAKLAALAGLSPAADKLAYFTGASAMALTDFTSYARTLVALASKAAVQSELGISSSGFQTGMRIGFVGAAGSVPSGWVLADGRTIGDASSSATNRANADTSALFTLLWNSTADAECPVSGGRGANAAADFAAHKRLTLPDYQGRAAIGKDDMSGTSANRITSAGSGITGTTLLASGGVETYALATPQIPAHVHDMFNGSTGGGSDMALGSRSFTHGNSGSAGGGLAHQNTQPSIVENMIIKL